MEDDNIYNEDIFKAQDAEDRREERIRAFDAQVERQMQILRSGKIPEERRIQAAYWLGNSGAPKAISILSLAYEKARNKKIKSAVAYALGQFKALEEAIEREPDEPISEALGREENLHVIELLEDITMGRNQVKKSRLSRTLFTRIQIGLAISLIVLLVLNVAFAVLLGGEDTPAVVDTSNLNPVDAQAVNTLQLFRNNIAAISLPADTLQSEFESGTLDCETPISVTYTLNIPPEVEAAYEAIPALGSRIEAAATQVLTALNTRVEACAAGQPPTAEETEQVTTSMSRVQAELDTIGTEINALIDGIIAAAQREPTQPAATTEAAATSTAVPTATSTPTETPTPTPTIDPATINRYIIDLNFIVEEVNGLRGSNTLLATYWNDAQTAGRTDACRETPPNIPLDYDISQIPEDVLAVAPQLEQAATQINTGLGLLRQGWRLFQNSCQEGTLSANAPTGIIVADTSTTAFETANDLLLELRRR